MLKVGLGVESCPVVFLEKGRGGKRKRQGTEGKTRPEQKFWLWPWTDDTIRSMMASRGYCVQNSVIG